MGRWRRLCAVPYRVDARLLFRGPLAIGPDLPRCPGIVILRVLRVNVVAFLAFLADSRAALPPNRPSVHSTCQRGKEEPLKKDGPLHGARLLCLCFVWNYIMPPAGMAGAAGAGSGMSTMPHSVVRNMPATLAAFSRATRDTLVGSMTPASYMFTYSLVRAL